MAQKRKKRSRKHRGTQGGRIDRKGRTSRPVKSMSRQERAERARAQRQARQMAPPTWNSAVKRAAVAAVVFGLIILLLGQPPVGAVVLGLFMFLVYIPLGYGTDVMIHRWRMRREQRAREQKAG